jgi:hypothetical protein
MDQNLCYLVGRITWYANWEPKKWGGTFACRIALPDINIEGVGSIQKQSIFTRVSYREEDMKNSHYTRIQKIMDDNLHIKVSGATVANREKNGVFEYFLKTNLYSCSTPLKNEELNRCIVHGQCTSHNGEWMQIKTSYRNPKLKEKVYRYINILDLESEHRDSLENKWITVFGELATKDIEGNDLVYIVANKIV